MGIELFVALLTDKSRRMLGVMWISGRFTPEVPPMAARTAQNEGQGEHLSAPLEDEFRFENLINAGTTHGHVLLVRGLFAKNFPSTGAHESFLNL